MGEISSRVRRPMLSAVLAWFGVAQPSLRLALVHRPAASVLPPPLLINHMCVVHLPHLPPRFPKRQHRGLKELLSREGHQRAAGGAISFTLPTSGSVCLHYMPSHLSHLGFHHQKQNVMLSIITLPLTQGTLGRLQRGRQGGTRADRLCSRREASGARQPPTV